MYTDVPLNAFAVYSNLVSTSQACSREPFYGVHEDSLLHLSQDDQLSVLPLKGELLQIWLHTRLEIALILTHVLST